jgi:hypothetical protein
MPEKEDHLSNELAISAALDLENRSIKASVRSRAISSCDRLIGAYFDVKTARLEKEADSIRNNKDDGGMPLFLTQEDRIDAGIKERELRKLFNKKIVVEAAMDDIKSSAEESDDTNEPMSEDWLNSFESHAENVSNDELRHLWARVLAGEIRKPRSFSLRTLRLLSEIDATTAKSFEIFVSDRIADDHILKREGLTGAELMEAIELEEAGLVQDVISSRLEKSLSVGDNHKCTLTDNGFVAIIEVREGITELRYPIVKITRVGKELCNLLTPRNSLKCLEKLSQHFIDKGVSDKAILATIEEQNVNSVRWSQISELKASSEDAGSE